MSIIGDDCQPDTASPADISRLKLSDSIIHTFLKLIKSYKFYHRYMLDHICGQMCCKMVILWAETYKLPKMFGHIESDSNSIQSLFPAV